MYSFLFQGHTTVRAAGSWANGRVYQRVLQTQPLRQRPRPLFITQRDLFYYFVDERSVRFRTLVTHLQPNWSLLSGRFTRKVYYSLLKNFIAWFRSDRFFEIRQRILSTVRPNLLSRHIYFHLWQIRSVFWDRVLTYRFRRKYLSRTLFRRGLRVTFNFRHLEISQYSRAFVLLPVPFLYYYRFFFDSSFLWTSILLDFYNYYRR